VGAAVLAGANGAGLGASSTVEKAEYLELVLVEDLKVFPLEGTDRLTLRVAHLDGHKHNVQFAFEFERVALRPSFDVLQRFTKCGAA
jgi:hypothetical protein